MENNQVIKISQPNSLKQNNTKKKEIDNESSNINNKQKIFVYSQFHDNDVLHVVYTIENIIMLLRNGTCVTWGKNQATLGRKCEDSSMDSFLPFPLKISTKIVDLVCGRNHCLARGLNFKVYSWGINSCGQLGLSGLAIADTSEKDLPTEIQAFQNIKIKQIFASGNSSFAITEGGNNLYAWGDNSNGQLGFNLERVNKIQEPRLVDLTDKIIREMVIYQTKDGSKSYVAELKRPASTLSQAMVYFNNQQLHYKELELIDEKNKLEIQEELVKKRRNALDSGTQVIRFLLIYLAC